jgi:competence protein ComEC
MDLREANFASSTLSVGVGAPVTLTGIVSSDPDARTQFTQLTMRLDTGERVLVRTDPHTTATYGDTILVSGNLERVAPFLTDTNRIFDYPNYLRVRGIERVVSFADVSVTATEQGNPLVSWLLAQKTLFGDSVQQQLAPPASDLGLGLLLGVKQGLGDDLEEAFRRTGIIHIVVLSGYNVMLVIAFFWWFTSWFLPLTGRVYASLVGIAAFAMIVGFGATVVRASLMAGLLLIAKLTGNRYNVLRALVLAAFAMVVWNPYLLLYDLGFQLSFMATLGLVLFTPHFESTVVTNTTAISLRDIVIATTVTQLFVLPLLVYYIGEVSIVSVLVNVLVLPLVPIAMLLTFLVGTFSAILGPLAYPLAYAAQLVLGLIIWIAQWFDALPWAAVVVPSVPGWFVFAAYALIGLAYYWYHTRKSDRNDLALRSSQAAAPNTSKTPVFFD